jgi:hypothetical protein
MAGRLVTPALSRRNVTSFYAARVRTGVIGNKGTGVMGYSSGILSLKAVGLKKRACKPVARKENYWNCSLGSRAKKTNGKYQLSHNPGGMSDTAMTAARKHPAWNDRKKPGQCNPEWQEAGTQIRAIRTLL